MKHAPHVMVFVIAACFAASAVADHLLPDLAKTPGVSRTGLSKATICKTKWGKDERHVSDSMKQQVFDRYGYSGYDDSRCIHDKGGKTCEIDHLISRELGGADDLDNLWPESYGGRWNAHQKDTLENRLHKEMCAGRISLKKARDMLVHDWRKAYKLYYGNPK